MKGRVLVGPGMSEVFSVNIGLRQGSALSPLMFIMLMELVNRKVNSRGSIGQMLCVDDLAVVVEWVGDAGSTGGVEGGIWEA